MCICDGGFNVILNQALDTTSKRRIHGSLSKFSKNTWEEILMYGENYILNKRTSHTTLYSRIDFFLI